MRSENKSKKKFAFLKNFLKIYAKFKWKAQ